MPKKKSVRLVATKFTEEADSILAYQEALRALPLGQKHVCWGYEYAVIRPYRSLEALLLGTLIGAINNDTRVVARQTAIAFPPRMNDDACEFLITGGGYCDFKSREHLIKQIRRFLPDTHYLLRIVKDQQYQDSLERVAALRNLAAHNSSKAKAAAKKALNVKRLASSGSWLKKGNRLQYLVGRLKALASDIQTNAPY